MSAQLSVVIIGRNEGQRLETCIRSVQAVHGAEKINEIIYVDSASTDGSPERAAALGAKVLTVYPEYPAAAIGRNAGWQAASAPFILFLDGDTTLHPDFINVALKSFADSQVAVVWGHRRERYPMASVYQRALDLDWVYPPGISAFCGGDALMRRAVLEEVGGYDEQLIAGEEPELCQRIRAKGHLILHIDQPMTLHDLAITQGSQYWRRAVRAGHAYAEVSNLLRQRAQTLAPKQQKQPVLWQRESLKNLIHVSVFMDIFLIGIVVSFVWDSVLPIIMSLLIFMGLSLRSAWKAHWKSNDFISLLLYGFHSQFQHIPIFVGQLQYHYHRIKGKRRQLIEYK